MPDYVPADGGMTGADLYFAEQMSDPEYRAAHEEALRALEDDYRAYHMKELGYGRSERWERASGLMGVLLLLAICLHALLITVVTLPFVLFGVAEVVHADVTHWRVRWIRDRRLDPSNSARSEV